MYRKQQIAAIDRKIDKKGYFLTLLLLSMNCKLAPEKSGTNCLRAGGVQSQRDLGAGNRQLYRCRL